jgi:hypothetical protein
MEMLTLTAPGLKVFSMDAQNSRPIRQQRLGAGNKLPGQTTISFPSVTFDPLYPWGIEYFLWIRGDAAQWHLPGLARRIDFSIARLSSFTPRKGKE